MEKFIPKGRTESSNKTIRMPDELINRIEEVMKEKDQSFSAIVNQCCVFALDHMDQERKE